MSEERDVLSFTPNIISGLFGGACEDGEELLWVLTLVPTAQPSAFGAAFVSSARSESFPPSIPHVIHGQWQDTNGRMEGKIIDVSHPGTPVATISATVQVSSSGGEQGAVVRLSGELIRYVNGHRAPEAVRFAMQLEEEDARTHLSGLWLGACPPAPELAAFMIPTNPVRWCLGIVFPHGQEERGKVSRESPFVSRVQSKGTPRFWLLARSEFHHPICNRC
jgi:hypothetical protein